jgi:endo-1,4-beta-xylanase
LRAIIPEKERGSVDYSMRIASANFADNNQMDLIGHLLLWGKDVPQWVRNGNFSREQLIEIMEERVRNTITTMTRHGVKPYIVVNEFGSGADILLERIGEDYVQMGFPGGKRYQS